MITSDYITIPLTKGQQTIIDTIDADLAQLKWYASQPEMDKERYYATRGIRNGKQHKQVRLHVILLERMLGRTLEKGEEVDHINGDTLDNKRSNLRLATSGQNSINTKLRSDNTSGIRGVFWHSVINKWWAYIDINKQRINLGYFIEKEDAIKVRKEAEEKYFGEFRRK